jgi:2',3'-cyclic-nucleotide 2'-phosphodiesterase (5'-nucleotidase family)
MILEASSIALALLLATQTTPASRNKQQQQEILDMVGIGTKDQGRAAPEKEADVALPEAVPGEGGFSTKPKTQTLTLLHSADQEADLISHRAVGGISRFVSVLEKLKGLSNNPMVVASGDTFLPSPSLRLTMDKENAVVAANNLVGFQVAAVGNHEFDLGDTFFAEVVGAAGFPYISSNMSIVGGELADVFEAQPLDQPAPWLQDKAGKLIQRAKYCAGGQLTMVPPTQSDDPRPVYPGLKVKIIGGDNLRSLAQKAYGDKEKWDVIYNKNQLVIKDPDNLQADAEVTIPLLEGMSPQYCTGVSVGVVAATTDRLHTVSGASEYVKVSSNAKVLRTQVQEHVNALTSEGVNIIVLLSHLQGITNDIDLVTQGLKDVDIIIAGGGDNLLANVMQHRLIAGDSADPVCFRRQGSCYPMLLPGKNGAPVLLVATDGQYRYIGRLVADFDEDGILTGYDEKKTKPFAVDEENMKNMLVKRHPKATSFEDKLAKALKPLSKPMFFTKVFFNGLRHSIRNRETNLGNLHTDSMVYAARHYAPKMLPPIHFGMVNSGGIRSSFGRPDAEMVSENGMPITELQVQSALLFNNPLRVVTTTHGVIKETFEAALRGVGTGRGHFPQISKEVMLEYDPEASEQVPLIADNKVIGIKKAGQRVKNLFIKTRSLEGKKMTIKIVENGKLLTPDQKITCATTFFLSRGGDGYFPGAVQEIAVTPIARKHKGKIRHLTEQTAVKQYIRRLKKKKKWKEGTSYSDPDPKKADTFGRIIALEPKS